MGNADAQEAYYNRTFWEAILQVIPIATIQTLALAFIFLLALFVARFARFRVGSMHLFTISILISFAVWPTLYFIHFNFSRPADNPYWFPPVQHSFVMIALLIILCNLPALIPIAWSLLACFFAGWLSSLRFQSGYFIAFLALPAAWLCQCYPGAPR